VVEGILAGAGVHFDDGARGIKAVRGDLRSECVL
jgi:hypothetical protein